MSRTPATTPVPAQTRPKPKKAKKAKPSKSPELRAAETARKRRAAQLAQVVNLHIAGFSLADIGAAIGATPDEVDRMLHDETARYVRTQPALRTYVRNWISREYKELLDTVAPAAKDPAHPKMLDSQDRALRILDRMAKLHGADAPTQTEVKVEAQPEAVENMVKALAAARGQEYDEDIFDIEIVEESVTDEEWAEGGSL